MTSPKTRKKLVPVDGKRMAIRGGSAGGYTTLCALVFHTVFAAGASYYGVADLAALAQDTGGSLVLTYWPSEFSQIRGQLRRTRYGENLTANELLFQFQFSIGAHGAHPF